MLVCHSHALDLDDARRQTLDVPACNAGRLALRRPVVGTGCRIVRHLHLPLTVASSHKNGNSSNRGQYNLLPLCSEEITLIHIQIEDGVDPVAGHQR